MSVNLEKHKSALTTAWKEVVEDKIATDWVLLGYDGLSNDLKVVSKGAGGIEEMKDELNSAKIMYAFCRLLDPKTSLNKFVLINWQGEGAPINRKGSCAGHLRDIASFFKGAHVTINARNEEEVDYDAIIDKLSKSTGSSYSFKTRSEPSSVKEPVGTIYKKVIPAQEINSVERDKFWAEQEAAEQKRQAEELKRKEKEQQIVEIERHRRESTEAAAREAKSEELDKSLNNCSSKVEKETPQTIVKRRILETENTSVNSKEDELRRIRKLETQEIISTRTVNARAIFEQNRGSSGNDPDSVPRIQANSNTNSYTASPSTGAVSNIEKIPSEPNLELQNNVSSVPQSTSPEPTSQNGTHETRQILANGIIPDTINVVADLSTEISLEEVKKAVPNETSAIPDSNKNDSEGVEVPSDGLRAVALYDYQAADETEISFDPGHIISHIDQIDVGWWQGLGPDGTYGLFPANYVELLDT